MNADGSDQRRLTNNSLLDTAPSWSPDGTKIVFRSDSGSQGEIYVMNANGTNPIRLTNNSYLDDAPRWSPEETKIAFLSNRNGNFEIYVMNSDGTNQTNLTNNFASDFRPVWSPNNSKIAFTSTRDTSFSQIYVMNANGSAPVRLSFSNATEELFDWRSSVSNHRTLFDFDGDGKADVSVFRPSNGAWYLQGSTSGFTGVSFGVSTALPVPADYDGDGKTDIAVFRGGTWYLNRSTQGFTGISFGAATDKPVPNAFIY